MLAKRRRYFNSKGRSWVGQNDPEKPDNVNKGVFNYRLWTRVSKDTTRFSRYDGDISKHFISKGKGEGKGRATGSYQLVHYRVTADEYRRLAQQED